jgi:hypothetical protein
MAIYTKSGTWRSISKVFAKDTTWKTVKRIFVKTDGTWRSIWPTLGPYTTEQPVIRLHSYRSTGYKDVGDVIQMGPGSAATPPTTIQDGESGAYTSAKLWGYDGTWANNTNAVVVRNFYYNSYNDFASANTASGVTDAIANDNSSSGILRFDNKYLWYYVEQTTTVKGYDYSNPLFIIKKRPITPSSFSITTPGTATVGIPITLTYTIEDSSVWYRNPDLSLSYVEWFAENSITSNPSNYIFGSKKYLNETTSFTPTISENNKYIHAKITLINSYSTYYNDLNVTSVANTTSAVQQSSPPVVNSYPTLSGTPSAFSYITATSGSYSNYSSKTTEVVVSTTTTSLTQGSNTDNYTMSKGSSNYTVNQSDATNVSYNFYSRDTVYGVDGKTYYYYSSPTKSTMGVVSDDFNNRTLTNGTGTMSSGFTYSGPGITPYASGLSWKVQSGYGVSSTAVSSSDGPSMWPLRSIEMGGKTDVYVSVDLPGSTGGLGVAFWAASTANWWSARCYHETGITAVETCTGTGGSNTTGAPTSPSSGTGSACNITTSTSYACGATQYSSSTSVTESAVTVAGGACSVTTTFSYACLSTVYSGSTGYPSNVGTGSGQQCNVASRTLWQCSGGYQERTSGPYTEGNNIGDFCGSGSYLSYPCEGGVTYYNFTQTTGTGPGAYCYVGSSTTYPCNSSTYTSSTPISNGGDTALAVCNATSSTVTSYSCDGSAQGPFSSQQATGTNFGDKCNESTSTAYGFVYVTFSPSPSQSATTCNASNVGKYQTGTRTSAGSGFFNYYYCQSTTTYNYRTRSTATNTTTYYYQLRSSTGTVSYGYQTRSSSGTTVYYANTRNTSGTTYYDYSLRSTSATTTWYYYTRSYSPTTTYTWNTIQTNNTTTYNTYIKIAAAEGGSTVNEKGSSLINSSTSGYLTVWGITASTSGNSISSWLKGSGGSTLGNVYTLNASFPTKADGSGSSSAGIIKGYSSANVGTSFDNLLII